MSVEINSTENPPAASVIAADRWILVSGNPDLDISLGDGHHAAAEKLASGIFVATTRKVARRQIFSTGGKCRTARPGMTAVLNLDIAPLGTREDESEFYHESHILLLLEECELTA